MGIKNNNLLKALKRQPTDHTPIWLMRQAGRYLPEYRQVRKQAGDFKTLCQTPELACEVAMQPLRRYSLDAAILFSDILTIPDAMGLGLSFEEGEGPCFANPIRTADDIKKLFIPDPETELRYVMDTVRLIHQSLNQEIPLIGFAGSPWTLACYMVEGGASKSFNIIKKMLYREPKLLTQLLQTLTQATINYLNAQIAAGVDVVMLFDTWGGILTTEDYQQYSLNNMMEIIRNLQLKNNEKIPSIIFTKQSGQWLELMAQSGCDAVGLDWIINLSEARRRIGKTVALQGNLDPAALYAEPEFIINKVNKLLNDYGSNPGHIFNLGHGLLPDTPPEHVQVLVEAVKSYKSRVD